MAGFVVQGTVTLLFSQVFVGHSLVVYNSIGHGIYYIGANTTSPIKLLIK